MAGAELGGVPVSPPGALSQRTDQPVRAMPDAAYGEAKEFAEIQSAAPMAGPPRPAPTPLFAPSARPGEPVTSGVDFGDGVGMEALAAGPQNMRAPRLQDTLSRLAAASPGDSRTQRLLDMARRYDW